MLNRTGAAEGRLGEAGKGHLAMLGFAMIVALSFPFGAMVGPHIDPAVLTAVRFAVAAAVMWALALGAGQAEVRVFRAPWRYFALAGLFALYFVTMFEGLKTAEPVSMAAVFTLNPALTAVFGWLVVRQATTARMALAIAIGGAGALWVIFRGDPSALARFEIGRGEQVYFWGCIGHALYSPLLRRLNRGEPALAFTAAILTAGAAILGLWAAPDILATDWAALPPVVWWVILYTALMATGVTFLIMRFATLRLPSAKVMAYTYLVPSCVILWQLALGQGAPAAAVLPGVALTVISLLLLLKDEDAHRS